MGVSFLVSGYWKRDRFAIVCWVVLGNKLAILLGAGWEFEEINRWSNERWKSGNPREWSARKKE